MTRRLLLVILAVSTTACTGSRPAEATPSAPAPAPTSASAAPATPAPKINTDRAWDTVKQFVAIGSRKPGSAGHDKAVEFLRQRIKQAGAELEEDKFTANTPAGTFNLDNVIAKIPGTKDGIIVFASHYETNYPLPDKFVGANDGGSTSGLLLELMKVLKPASGKRDGYSIWFVWDDGEEAFEKWDTQKDALWGTKHLAQKWQQDGTAKKIKALFVLDMIGDRDLDIQREEQSTPWLLDLVLESATKLGYQSHFFQTKMPVEDDHLPFKWAGVPVADIIDINYGFGSAYHHSLEDTLDKLSPKSLQIVGDTMLETIWALDQR